MKNEDLLLELLREVRDETKENGKKLSDQGEELARQSVCLDNVEKDIKVLKTDMSKNTKDVAKHIYRSDMLEDLHKDNQKRIEGLEKEAKIKEERLRKLEKPAIAKAWFKENLKWLLTISALTTTLVTKIIGLW